MTIPAPAFAAATDTGSIFAALRWGLTRDLAIAFRSRNELVVQLVFFVLVASLFPLTLAPEPATLAMLGPGVLWVAALLSSLLALPRLFGRDFDDGTLAQLALSPRPLAALVSGKMLAHWLVTGLPVVVLAPALGAAYRLDAAAGGLLAASLALGTPILSLLGGIVGALTLGARGGGGLAALLALPLYVPVLIFGSGAVAAQAAGLPASPHLSLLAAGLLLAGMAAPFAAASAIRIALD